jgi:hypothetical protein
MHSLAAYTGSSMSYVYVRLRTYMHASMQVCLPQPLEYVPKLPSCPQTLKSTFQIQFNKHEGNRILRPCLPHVCFPTQLK